MVLQQSSSPFSHAVRISYAFDAASDTGVTLGDHSGWIGNSEVSLSVEVLPAPLKRLEGMREPGHEAAGSGRTMAGFGDYSSVE